MRKLLLTVAVFFTATISAQEYAGNRLVVGLKANKTNSSNLEVFNALNDKFGCSSIKQFGAGKRKRLTRASNQLSSEGMIVLSFDSEINVKEALLEYQSTGLFRYVEPDYKGHGESTIPNDPIFGNRQYYHVNSGNFNETPSHPAKVGADMDSDLAWDVTTGNSNVVLGVFDSGLDFTNAEFSGRHWVNSGEIPNNNIDDDNNGYVDDINGWDFVNDDNNGTDDHSHGTNVTGIAAATGNNGFGMAGMDWQCKIMTLKVLASDNSGWYSNWSESLYYAADNGIHVGNMSLSGSSFSQSFQDAVDYATNAGVLVVVAMGNDDYGTVRYPAGFANAMAVGALNPDDTRVNKVTNSSWGSNYGSHIDCVAAGQRVYSARHNDNTNFNWWKGGTSMATPLVAGIACLVKGMDMNLTPALIREAINSTCEDMVGDPSEDVQGFDNYYGHGRVNAYQAVLAASTITSTNEFGNDLKIYPNPFNESLTVVGNGDARLYAVSGELVKTFAVNEKVIISTASMPSGVYFLEMGGVVKKLVKK